MRIDKLEIKGFGKIKNRTIELSNGLNIIYGCNESGKTTLWWFIRGMLFGLKGGRQTKDGVPPPLKRYKPWNGGSYGGFMEYTLDCGEQYRVERDFDTGSVRIFDSHFNDITGTFDVTRESGVQFAEKHIGLNDACFEKTALIRQMNARIDEDGSRELVSRLVNVSQTGFEDVSFKKAEQALKDALKVYVGTERTTERPLDKAIRKIAELREQKISLISERESFLSTQRNLNNALTEKVNIDGMKKALMEAGKIIELFKEGEGYKSSLIRLDEIIEKILSIEDELGQASGRLKEAYETCEQLAAFSNCSDVFIDELNFKYHKLRMLQNENMRLEQAIEVKKQQCIKLEAEIEPYRKLAMLGEDSDRRVIGLKKEIDSLRYEQGRYIAASATRRELEGKERKRRISITVSFALLGFTAACMIIGVSGKKGLFAAIHPIASLTAALSMLVLALVQAYMGIKLGREISSIKNMQKEELLSATNIAQSIAQIEGVLTEMLEKAGATSTEEFIAMKASCDGMIQRLNILNSELGEMEESFDINLETIYQLKAEIIDRLVATGIMNDGDEEEIEDKQITEFKTATAKYKEFKTAAEYLSERVEDLKKSLKTLYENASSICMKKCSSIAELSDCREGVHEKADRIAKRADNAAKEALQQFKDVCLGKPYFELFVEAGKEQAMDDLERDCKAEYKNVCDLENALLLRIKEYETILKGAPDDDEIQKVQEQLEELELKKSELEDKGEALRIAIDVLTETSIELQRDFVPLLNSRMGGIISSITTGKYKEIRADDSLFLKTISPETLDVTNAGVLSYGTVEQMYFALRVAMAELITSGEKLPLIMDETFAYYDDMRSMGALKFLSKLSSDRQIVLFTCKTREVEMAKRQRLETRYQRLDTRD